MIPALSTASIPQRPVVLSRSRGIDSKRKPSLVASVPQRHLSAVLPPSKIVVRSVFGEENEHPIVTAPVLKEGGTGDDTLQTIKDMFGYFQTNEVSKAEKLFERLVVVDIELYNRVLKAVLSKGQPAKCWHYFQRMEERGLKPDAFTYSIMMSVCGRMKWEDKAMELWKEVEENEDCECDRVLYNSFSQVFISIDRPEKAIELLEEMKAKNIQPDTVTYNTLIKGLSSNVKDRLAAVKRLDQLLVDMKAQGLTYDLYTYRALIRFSLSLKDTMKAIRYTNEMLQSRKDVDVHMYAAVIDDFVQAGELGKHKEVMDHCWQLCVDFEKKASGSVMEVYEALMKLFVKYGRWNNVFGLIDRMQALELPLSRNIYNTVLKGMARDRFLGKEGAIVAQLLVDEMSTTRTHICPDMYASLICIFLQARDLGRAQTCLEKVKNSSAPLHTGIYNLFLNYHSDAHHVTSWSEARTEVCRLMEDMKAASLQFNLDSYTAIIRTCTKSNDWETLDTVLDMMEKRRVHPQFRSYNAILNMCARSEDPERIQKAWTYFEAMKRVGFNGSVVTYTTMINVCDAVGDLASGLTLAEEMKSKGIRLNEHTYTSLMHLAGKANDLDTMEKLYQEYLTRDFPHNATVYSVRINAYGKANQIDKVIEIHSELLYKNIPIDSTIFRNLLQAASDCHRIDLLYQFYDEYMRKRGRMDHAGYALLASALEKNGDFEGAAAVLELEKEQLSTPQAVIG